MNSSPKILVVDDEPINVKLLQRKLEHVGFEVSVGYDGETALEKVSKVKPDLILLDIMMPGLDGIEVCKRLKKNDTTHTIPIIFITAKTSKKGKLYGLSAGAIDYITKPIDLDETVARIKTQLRIQDIHRHNLDLQARLNEARQSAAIGAITQGIAHNLNNLLGVVVGYLDLIDTCSDKPDMVKRSAGLMNQAIKRIINIVQQLSLFATKKKVQLSLISLDPLIKNSIERFCEENKVKAKVNVENATPDTNVNANAEVFENIMGLLLINAWESYPEGTTDERDIQIHTEIINIRGEKQLQLTISDQGEGINSKIADHVFEPFISSKTSVGRGMGLTIARHSIRNLGGDIYLKDNLTPKEALLLSSPTRFRGGHTHQG